MLATNGLGGFTPIGLTQNADNLFGAMRFAFHKWASSGRRNTHIKTGSTFEGHATTKAILDDKIEIVDEYKHLQVRTATVVSEDGTELSRSFHRRVLAPDADVSGESAEIQGIAAAVWTDDVKSAWQIFQAEQEEARP